MKFQLLSTVLLISAVIASPVVERTPHPPPSPHLPFNFTYAFTAVLELGSPVKPITIPGGILVAEPIKSGKVTGPAVNATILGGLAHPTLYDNHTLQVPSIEFYGVSDDGQSFYGHDAGVGSNAAQINRVEITIGGAKYVELQEGFFLASVTSNTNKTVVTVEAWLVKNKTI